MATIKLIRFFGVLLVLELAAAASLIPRAAFDMGPPFQEPAEIPRKTENLHPIGAKTKTVSPEILDQLKITNPYTINTQENGLSRNITYTMNQDGSIDIMETGDILLADLLKNPDLISSVDSVSIQELLESKGQPIPKTYKDDNVEQHAVYNLYDSENGNKIEPGMWPQVPARAPHASAQTPQGNPVATGSGMEPTNTLFPCQSTIFSTIGNEDYPTYNSASNTPQTYGNGFAIPIFSFPSFRQLQASFDSFARNFGAWTGTPTHLLKPIDIAINSGNPSSVATSQALTSPIGLHYITFSRKIV